MADKIQININTTLRKPNEAEISKFKKDIEKQISQININTSNGKGIKLLDTKEIDLYKQKMNNMLERLKIGKDSIFIKPEIQRQVQEFTNELNKLGTTGAKSTKELGVQFDTLKTNVSKTYAEFNKLNPQMQNMHKHGYDLASMFDMGAKKALIWMAVMNLIYAPIKMLRYAVLTMKEVETQLVSINRVMEDTTFNMQSFGKSLFDIAKSMGSTFKDASDVALRFAQAGYNVNDTLDLTRTAIMAVQTAELNAKNATESLIGIMSQWQLSANDMPLLLDKINYISDQYTVTSQDLVDGLLRSSSAARNLGISIDETISLLTVLRETSGRTGREVGNALNSILSYITRGKTLDVLEKSGISVFADASKTQFRNFMDVLTDIADKWNGISVDVQNGFIQAADEAGLFNEELAETLNLEQEWSDIQRRDISNSAAGTYRRNYFLALMNGFTKTKDVLKDLENAEGYTIAELDKKVKTLDSRFKIFIDTLQQLAVNFGNNGALEFAKTLVNLGTVLVGVIDKFGVLNTILVGTSIYLGMSGTLIKWIPMFKELGIATGVWAVSMGASEKAALGLARAMTTLYPLLAVVALWAVVEVLDATTVSLEEQTEKVNTLKNSISDLQSEYDKLLTNNNRTDEEQKYLELLEKELELQKANLKTETERLANQKYFKGDITNTGGVTGIGGINKSIYGSGQSGQINQYIADLKRLREELSNSDSVKESKGIQEKINSIEQSLITSRKEIKEYIDVLGTDTPPALLSLANAIDEIILKTNDQTTSTNDATTATDKEIKSIEELAKAIADSQNKLLDLNNAIKEYNENGEFSSETLNSLIKQYPQLMQYLGNEQRLRQELVNIIESESNIQAQNYVNMLQNSEDFYNRVLEGQNLLADGLNKAYGIDLKNYKSLAEAKFDIEKKLLSGFGDMWRDYYDAQSGQMTANISELSRLASMNDPQAKALLERIRLASQTTNKLNDFTLGLAKTDLAKININKDKDGKEKTLSDYLPREQELLNYISNAENKIKDLTQEEYQARLDGIKPIEDANNALISYYKNVRATLTDKEMIADINSKIIKLEGDNASLAKERKDIEDDIVKAKEKQAEADQKNLEDIQKQIVEVIKKRYEIEKDEAEKAHKEKIEQLDDELDAYKENVDAQIKEIDRLRDKEDFDKSQQKTTDKITELTNERNTLSLAAQSGDLTAIERIKEIDKDLAEQRENLSELQQDREDELRKQNLQDMLDEKEKEIKSAKESAEEQWEIEKDKYEKLLEEGNLYAEANKALTTNMVTDINGKLVTVAEAFKSFSDQFGQTLGTLGSNIQTEFIDKLNQAQMLINTMSGLDASTGIVNNVNTSALSGSSLNTNALSSVNLSSILEKINLTNIIPNFTMPKMSAVGASSGNNVNISVPVNVSGGADKVNALEIGNTVAKIIRQELNKSGIFR
jgi:TP901 family phage tail tape measure protein